MNTDTSDKSQSDKFKEAARNPESDPSEAAFDRMLKKLIWGSPSKDWNPELKEEPGQ